MNKKELDKARQICEGELALLRESIEQIEANSIKTQSTINSLKESGQTATLQELDSESQRLNSTLEDLLIKENEFKAKIEEINFVSESLFSDTPIPEDSTLGHVIDEYALLAEAMEVHRSNIITSLINKGLVVPSDSKLSVAPEEILKLPTLGGDLPISTPNVGAMVDTKDQEYDVTSMSSYCSLGDFVYNNFLTGEYFGGFCFTSNYCIATSNGILQYAIIGDPNFTKINIDILNVACVCSDGSNDEFYCISKSFAIADTYTVSKLNVDGYVIESWLIYASSITHCKQVGESILVVYQQTNNNSYLVGRIDHMKDRITRYGTMSTNPVTSFEVFGNDFVVSIRKNNVYKGKVDNSEAFKSYPSPVSNVNIIDSTIVGDKIILHGDSGSSYSGSLSTMTGWINTDYPQTLQSCHVFEDYIISYNITTPKEKFLQLNDLGKLKHVFDFPDILNTDGLFIYMNVIDYKGVLYFYAMNSSNLFIHTIAQTFEMDLKRR